MNDFPSELNLDWNIIASLTDQVTQLDNTPIMNSEEEKTWGNIGNTPHHIADFHLNMNNFVYPHPQQVSPGSSPDYQAYSPDSTSMMAPPPPPPMSTSPDTTRRGRGRPRASYRKDEEGARRAAKSRVDKKEKKNAAIDQKEKLEAKLKSVRQEHETITKNNDEAAELLELSKIDDKERMKREVEEVMKQKQFVEGVMMKLQGLAEAGVIDHSLLLNFSFKFGCAVTQLNQIY